jgi:hypothetical protein
VLVSEELLLEYVHLFFQPLEVLGAGMTMLSISEPDPQHQDVGVSRSPKARWKSSNKSMVDACQPCLVDQYIAQYPSCAYRGVKM